MSTLTSTQMNVKRSSTRVHGPPGGASQLTFGPGGFGTNAPAPEPDAENRDAVQRTEFIPQKPGLRTPYQQGTSNNQQQYSNQHQAPPPTALAPPQTGYGRPPPTGYAPPSTGYAPPQTAGGYGGYKPPATGYSQQGQERPQTMGWGRGASPRTQPPLTSSKRDQNWEKKRRQWLARKTGGSGNYTSHSSSASSFAPPMTAGGNNHSYGNPPSPLSKLMNNVSVGGPESNRGQSFPPPQQFRAPPSQQQQYQAPPQQQRYQQPPPTAYAPPNQGPPSHGYGGPPPMGYSRGGPPPTAASNYSYQDHSGYPPSSNGPKQGNSVFQQTGAAQFGQPQQFQRMPTSGSMPPTASSSRSTRQAPGGTSNWSPYG